MEPFDGGFDVSCASNSGPHAKKDCLLFYYSFTCPNRRMFDYPGQTFEVDVIDTWDMTVTSMGRMSDCFTVKLPAKPYMAIRLTKVN